MKVAIINNTAAGKATEVHAPGCADVPKAEKRNKDTAWVIEVESLVDLSMSYWADQISDQVEPDSAEGWDLAASWTSEFNVLPCVKGLAHDHREAPEEAAPAAEEAPAATVTTWVGKAIAAKIVEVFPRTHPLVTLVNEAKATKAGDRTLKLAAAEVEALAAFCTELEGKGGSLAYSARTLRSRLA